MGPFTGRLWLLTVFAILNGVRGGCPGGWAGLLGSCYLLQPTPVDHAAAVALCRMYDASLVSVTTSHEQDMLRQMMTASRGGYQSGDVKYWTGLSAAVGQPAYRWSDHSAVNENVLQIRSPTATVGQKCSVWDTETGVFSFISCLDRNRPFCKRSAALDFIDKCNTEDGWRDINGACYKLYDVTSSWSDARGRCLRDDGDLYSPGASPYVIDSLVTCRMSVTHIWLGVSDTAHAGTLLTTNKSQPAINWAPGDNTIIEPGNTCGEVVTTSTNSPRFQTDLCDHEKQFICQKPYGTCPSGWIEHKGRCYLKKTTPTAATAWFLAKQQCEDQGAELLILNSMDEHNFISNQLIMDSVTSLWLGFSDEVTPDVLRWVDGSPASGSGVFGVWSPGYPAPKPQTLDCGLLHVGSANGSWGHGYCFEAKPYACEIHIGKPLSSATSARANNTCDQAYWTMFRDKCFYFGRGPQTWDGATEDCRSKLGRMAILNEPYMQSFVSLSVPDDITSAWIGLKMDAHNSKYYWVDYTDANFTNYASTPAGGCIAIGRDETLSQPGRWFGYNCSKTLGYVCEKGVDPYGWKPTTVSNKWNQRCEPGWTFGSPFDSCFLVMTGAPKTWLEASYDCQRRGGHLLSVSKPDEQQSVEVLLKRNYPQYQNLWIGASDSTREGGWEWSDGSAFRYLHWYPGEPDDQNTGANCAQLVAHRNYRWDDGNCDDRLDYICEKPARPPVTSPTPAIPTLVPPTQCEFGPIISGTYSVQSDFAFTASSQLDNRTASDSRLLSSNLRSWRPARDRVGEYLEVRFYQAMAMDSMTMAGEQNSFSFVTKFKIKYQYNEHSPWYWIESAPNKPMVFNGVTDDDSIADAFFPSVIYARGVRLYPVEWGNHIAVRWEFSGCFSEACTSDYALSGPLIVTDEGFSASGSSDDFHPPRNARLQPLVASAKPSCWRAPDAFDTANPPWIEVDLGTLKRLRGVTVMGNPDADEYVTLFQLLYRVTAGSALVPYQEPYGFSMNLTGNKDNNSTVTYLLKSIIPAQQVRLVVQAYHGHPALRFDLLVCGLATCEDMPLLSGRHNVSDSAFSASSSLAQHGPSRSRLSLPWSGSRGAWAAEFNDQKQFIQVDLGETIQVWAVATQGSQSLKYWVTSYTLAFSQDGQTFGSYSTDAKQPAVFDGNFDATTVRKHYLTISTLARYVQLWPLSVYGSVALRWELYGCPGPESGKYVGCFLDEESTRDLPYEALTDPWAHIGPVSCRYHCYNKGYAYAGLQRGIACYCGDSFGKYGSSLTSCTATCLPPYENENCGGHLANSVYSTGLVAPNTYCQPGWVGKGDYCYIVLEDMRSWFESKQNCLHLGAELASVASDLENDFVFSLLASLTTQGKYGNAWLGLNDLQDSFFYQWIDGSEVKFTNWDINMPRSNPSREQHCVALNNQTGGWRTVFCEEAMMRVCKMPKQPSAIPHLPPITMGCEKVGWDVFQRSCYSVMNSKQSWANAQRDCQTSGGSLVRINDRFEQSFVASLIGSMSGSFWSDVTDMPTGSNFAFSDNSYVTFTNWGPLEPTAHRACVGLQSGDFAGLWSTLNCSTPLRAICEKPRSGFPHAKPTPPLVPPGARCPTDWYQAELSCFQVNSRPANQRLNWEEAREDCENQGAYLASLHTHQDLEDVWRNVIAGNEANFWIGLHYNEQAKTMQWSDGSAVNFLQWASGETDALLGLMNCGEIKVDTGDMAHMSCGALRNWICSVARGTVPKPRTTVVVPTAGAAGSCSPLDDRWKMYGGSCYLVQEGVGDNARTWRAARTWCQNFTRSDLVSIASRQEQLFVQGLIHNVSSVSLWTGLNRLDFGHGYAWSDRSPTAFENWGAGQPDTFDVLQRCVGMQVKNGKWTEDACSSRHGFVCKQSATPFPTHKTPTTPAGSAGFCPAGYSPWGARKCLRVYGNSEGEPFLDWASAWDYCSRMGPGYMLASIGSKEENLFVVTLLGDNQLGAWFGMLSHGDGSFTWTDSSEVTFTNWDDGEPIGGVESCVYMKGSSSKAGLWNDAPCGQTANFVCQANRDPTITTPEPIPSPCDAKQGFKPFRSGCYKYVDTPANWTTASDTCLHLGSYLVTINDAFVQAFVQLLVANNTNNNPALDVAAGGAVSPDAQALDEASGNGGADVTSVWIGLSDRKTEGTYVWSLGWPMTFSQWALEEPARGVGEGCVLMGTDGLWVDADCGQQLPYVCAIVNKPLTPATPPPPQGQCAGEEWFQFGRSCYLFEYDRQTFYEAQLRCQERQAHLVSLHDAVTVDFLAARVIRGTEYNTWIGLYGSQTSGFSWLDSSPVDFTKWAANEPSGTDSQRVAEHCVTMDPRTKLWNDRVCDLHLPYICHKAQAIDESGKTRPAVVITPTLLTPTLVSTVSQKIPKPETPETPALQSTTTPPSTSTTTSAGIPGPTTKGPGPQRTSSGHSPAVGSVSTTSNTVVSAVPTAQSQSGSDSGISPGATAGIVIAVLIVLIGAAIAGLLYVRKRRGPSRGNLLPDIISFSNMLFKEGSDEGSRPDTSSRSDDDGAHLRQVTVSTEVSGGYGSGEITTAGSREVTVPAPGGNDEKSENCVGGSEDPLKGATDSAEDTDA